MSKKILLAGLFLLSLILIRYLYLKPSFTKDQHFPSFESPLENGASFKLDSLKGKYVLIDFWASWCRPCREENPALVKLYEDFKDSDQFEIVSIALENNKTKWLKAIENDQLIWPYQIYNNNGFKSTLAKKYGVREIPTKYLISPDQKIIFVNPSADELHEFLKNALKK